MIVVKLGGSLAEAESLGAWLEPLGAGRGHIVVVPGGGAFAETVRREQKRHLFSDRAAHWMAILAMEQYALLLADRSSAIVPCRTIAEMRAASAADLVPVWLPSTIALADSAVEASWTVTSDSLAARLARRLEAETLALVKSVTAARPLDAEALAARGMVDEAFPRYLTASGARLEWFGPGDEARFRRLLATAARAP